MRLQRFVDAVRADLSAVAELGDEATADAAGQLVLTLQASLGLRLLDALSEAALELNERLPSGHVEVRLAGQDPELVYVSDQPEAPMAGVEAALTARITLRLPEALKTMVEEAAAREGVSVNTWIVRALSRTSSIAPTQQSRLTGYAQSCEARSLSTSLPCAAKRFAVGCHRLWIGLPERSFGSSHLPLVAAGCARLAP